MFDTRPDFGRPDRGILSALTANATGTVRPGPDFAFVIRGGSGTILPQAKTGNFVSPETLRKQLSDERREMQRLGLTHDQGDA